MELEPGQPVFMKEVHGNIWKTGIINQPALEPGYYWIKFPDSSILKRTRSMIKPRSQPSHFELLAEGMNWNTSGSIPQQETKSFTSQANILELPAVSKGNSVPQAVTDRRNTHAPLSVPISFTGAISLPSQVAVVHLHFQAVQDVPPILLKGYHQ